MGSVGKVKFFQIFCATWPAAEVVESKRAVAAVAVDGRVLLVLHMSCGSSPSCRLRRFFLCFFPLKWSAMKWHFIHMSHVSQ